MLRINHIGDAATRILLFKKAFVRPALDQAVGRGFRKAKKLLDMGSVYSLVIFYFLQHQAGLCPAIHGVFIHLKARPLQEKRQAPMGS